MLRGYARLFLDVSPSPFSSMIPLADTHVHLLAGLDDGPPTPDVALAMCRAAPTLGVTLRAGVHTGEIERRENGDIGGLTVHIAGVGKPRSALVKKQPGAREITSCAHEPPLIRQDIADRRIAGHLPERLQRVFEHHPEPGPPTGLDRVGEVER